MSPQPDQSAFPSVHVDSNGGTTGISVRTYLAGQMLHAIVVNEGVNTELRGITVRDAIRLADTLIEELNK